MKKILFDLDGTLFNLVDFTSYLKKCLDSINFKYDDNVLKRINASIQDYERNIDHYDYQELNDYIVNFTGYNLPKDFINRYCSIIEHAVPEDINDTILVLEYLKDKYYLVTLTNWFKEVQDKRLENAGILKYFSETYGGNIKTKPHKEAFLNAIKDTNISDVIMIGDNINTDINGALNLGIKTIYLDRTNNYQSSTNMIVIKNIKELINIL